MTRDEAIGTLSYVVDDALNGRYLGADPHAILRTAEMGGFKYESAIVVVNTRDDGPIGVVVHSYLDTRMEEDESTELAVDYLLEVGHTILGTMFFPGEECSEIEVNHRLESDGQPVEEYDEDDSKDDTR